MKKVLIAVLGFVLFISCSTEKLTTIQGEITFMGGEQPDSIYVSLYQPRFGLSLGEPLFHQVISSQTFKFKLKPTLYKIAIYAKGYQTLKDNIFIQPDQDIFEIKVQLQIPCITQPVKNVDLLGSFNDWDVNKKMPLKKFQDEWILEDTSMLTANEDYYAFRVDGIRLEDLSNPDYAVNPEYADISSLYKGGKIVFNPSLYLHEDSVSNAEYPNSPIQKQYAALVTYLNNFQNDMYEPVRQNPNFGGDALKKHHQMLVQTLDSLKGVYDQVLHPMIWEREVTVQSGFHPVLREYYNLRRARADSAQLVDFVTSDKMDQYFRESLALTNKIEPASPLLNGIFMQLITNLGSFIDNYPILQEKYSIKPDFVEDYANNVIRNNPMEECNGNVLLLLGYYYKYLEDNAKVREYLVQLKNIYPNHPNVKLGYVDKVLGSLELAIGTAAPVFQIKTLDGKLFDLAQSKGKFVMIDFWGSWCGPCRGEVPNFKKLYETVSKDTLIFIGIARDDSLRLTQFIKEQHVTYPNALANEEVLDKYSVNSYPTTYLIDPEGKFLAKNLRGDDLIRKTREKIKAYYKQ